MISRASPLVFQFTPLREGRRGRRRQQQRGADISIHAPPRGATHGCLPCEAREQISIHAPPRGATCAEIVGFVQRVFQFTPLREGRRRCTGLLASLCISIHAPPRGATKPSSRPADIERYFNSRPSARGDKLRWRMQQSMRYFNSRPSARGDGEGDDCAARQQISIHAPPRGATSCAIVAFSKYPFQFTPLREGRHHAQEWIKSTINFNSRPSARGDVIGNSGGWLHIEFQFTPLREGRPDYQVAGEGLDTFQFTPLREGRPKE